MSEEFKLILGWERPQEHEDGLSGRTRYTPAEFTAEIYQLAGATWPIICFGDENGKRLEGDISEVREIGEALTAMANLARASLNSASDS